MSNPDFEVIPDQIAIRENNHQCPRSTKTIRQSSTKTIRQIFEIADSLPNTIYVISKGSHDGWYIGESDANPDEEDEEEVSLTSQDWAITYLCPSGNWIYEYEKHLKLNANIVFHFKEATRTNEIKLLKSGIVKIATTESKTKTKTKTSSPSKIEKVVGGSDKTRALNAQQKAMHMDFFEKEGGQWVVDNIKCHYCSKCFATKAKRNEHHGKMHYCKAPNAKWTTAGDKAWVRSFTRS
jgi:hypothetical protein